MIMFDSNVPYTTIQLEGQREDVMVITTVCNTNNERLVKPLQRYQCLGKN